MKTQPLCIFSGGRANSNKPLQRLHSGAFNSRYYITVCWLKTSVAVIHNRTPFMNIPSPMSWLVLLWVHVQLQPRPRTQSFLRQPKRTAHFFKIASRSPQTSALSSKIFLIIFALKLLCDARGQNVTHCINDFYFCYVNLCDYLIQRTVQNRV